MRGKNTKQIVFFIVLIFTKLIYIKSYCNTVHNSGDLFIFTLGSCSFSLFSRWTNAFALSTDLPTDKHHDNIIELSVRCCVWKVGEGFPGQVLLKTLKWVAVYPSVTFHING